MSLALPTAPAAPVAPRTAWFVAAFAAIYLIWGSTYLGIAIALETLPPFLLAGVRFLAAGALLYGVARLRGAPAPPAAAWRAATLAGALLMLGGNGLVTWAEQTVSTGLAALLIATVSLWVVLFDWLLFRGPRPSGLVLTALALGLSGVAVLVAPGATPTSASWLGLLVLVVSAASWALGTLYARRAALPPSPLMSSALQMLAGGALLALLGSATGEWARLDLAAVSASSVLAVAYLTVFGSIVAFSAFVWLARNASAAAVATYAFVNPVVAVLLGWVVLGEALAPRTALAAALIVAAVVLVVASRRAAAQRLKPR